MNRDYMAMAQGQAQPQENLQIQELAKAPESLEMPEGKDKESIKQRLIKLLETSGALQELKLKMSEQEIMKEIDTLATAMEAGDMVTIRKSPLIPIFEGLSDSIMGNQAQPQQAAPPDFAGMVGGMNG